MPPWPIAAWQRCGPRPYVVDRDCMSTSPGWQTAQRCNQASHALIAIHSTRPTVVLLLNSVTQDLLDHGKKLTALEWLHDADRCTRYLNTVNPQPAHH